MFNWVIQYTRFGLIKFLGLRAIVTPRYTRKYYRLLKRI